MSLPTTRQLLTSLLTTLTIPSQQPSISNVINEPYSAPSNPLKSIPSSQCALLTTLHVLFPPPMLLQALDLLDRGLVLRLLEKRSPPSPEGVWTVQQGDFGDTLWPPQANIHLPPGLAGESSRQAGSEGVEEKVKVERGRRNQVYQVRSSQPPKSRFRDSSTGGAASGSTVYCVRLGAWNCSCAAFAYSAFPGGGSSVHALWNASDREEDGMGRLREEAGEKGQGWEFGGLSFDGKEGSGGGLGGEGVPVCKHLVACLLGERWDVLRGYVREREVSTEEMAGIGGEG